MGERHAPFETLQGSIYTEFHLASQLDKHTHIRKELCFCHTESTKQAVAVGVGRDATAAT